MLHPGASLQERFRRQCQSLGNNANPGALKKAQEAHNEKRPALSFQPTPENLECLEEKRWEDKDRKPESNGSWLNRKLEKLRKLEKQGF